MRKLFPFLLVLIIGCGSDKVLFNHKTVVTFKDFDTPHKLAVTVDSIRGGVTILVENVGTEEISFDARSVFYEDASGNTLRAVNTFLTRIKYSSRFFQLSTMKVASGESNVMGILPPPEAIELIFKDADHNKVCRRVEIA